MAFAAAEAQRIEFLKFASTFAGPLGQEAATELADRLDRLDSEEKCELESHLVACAALRESLHDDAH